MKKLNIRLGVSFLALGMGLAPSVSAQNSDDFTFEEIVVTATKRAKSQQDVGLAVTAISGDQVRELGINDIEDVIGQMPGTGFNDVAGGGIPVVIIRGVGLQNFRINDTPTTAIYVDEVYQTSVAEAVATIFDVERVEVLKGPQGGLYGRNAVGGAIQVISARPNFEEFEGYLSLGYGKYNRIESEAAISGPVSDKLAYRFSGKMITSDDTYFHSVSGDFDHGEEERWAARGQLEFRPSETVNLLWKVHGGEDTSELALAHPVGMFRRLGLGLGAVTGIGDTADGAILNARSATTSITSICDAVISGGRDPSTCEVLDGSTPDEHGITSRYDSLSNARPQLDNSWWGTSLLATIEMGDYTLTSVTAYDDFDHGRTIDQDGMAEVHQEIDYHTTIEAWSQELRLGYDAGGAFSWILGVNYAEDEQVEDTLLMTETGILRTQIGGLTLAQQDYVQKTKAKSAYGRADWGIAEDLNLIVEARYTEEKKSFRGGVVLTQVSRALSYIDDSESYNDLSGKLGLEYSVNDNALLYASVSKGFKSGGFFGGFATSNAQLVPFENETILAYEAGFKTDWPEQSLRLNGSFFYYDRSDVQANARDPRGIVAVARLTNIGDVETYGVELEAVWMPTENFTLQGSAAYLKTEIVKSDLLTSDIFRLSNDSKYEGARLANQPEFSANATARYQKEISSSLLGSIQLEYSYRSEQDQKIVVLPMESAIVTEGGYSLVNLRAAVSDLNADWTLSGYVTNLFNEKYRESAGGTGPSGAFEIYGEPRIWGLQLEYRF